MVGIDAPGRPYDISCLTSRAQFQILFNVDMFHKHALSSPAQNQRQTYCHPSTLWLPNLSACYFLLTVLLIIANRPT